MEKERSVDESARWAGRLVVTLSTFWGFVLALVACWVIERTGVVSGGAFTWVLRIFTAAATGASYFLGTRIATRVPGRAVRPLAAATGLSIAVGLSCVFILFVIRPGR